MISSLVQQGYLVVETYIEVQSSVVILMKLDDGVPVFVKHAVHVDNEGNDIYDCWLGSWPTDTENVAPGLHFNRVI